MGFIYQRNNITDNLIINGDFDVWQRGTSFAALASGSLSADRWTWINSSAAVATISRSTDVPTIAQSGHLSNYSLLVDITTADASIGATDVAYVRHTLEGNLWRYIAQQSFVFSFWVKATKVGIYSVGFNNAAGNSFICEYSVNVTATWEKKTFVISASPSAGTWNYTTGTGIRVIFVLAAGSDFTNSPGQWDTTNEFASSNQVNGVDSTANDFRIAQVQIEPGLVASPFAYRDIEAELELCYRYYQRYETPNVALASGKFYATTAARFVMPLITEMRAAPTPSVTPSSGSLTVDAIGSGSTTFTTSTNAVINTKTYHFDLTGGSPARTVGQMGVCISPTVIQLSADL